MEPYGPSPAAAVATAAISSARRVLSEAEDAARTLDIEVSAVVESTRWRSRATDGYRSGVDELREGVALLVRRIGAFDEELRALAASSSWERSAESWW